MSIQRCILALVLAAAPLRAQDGSLRVMRHMPGDTASPGNVVAVIFDRPVAGRLGATVDPARIFHIEPVVPGRLSWRDPVTIRFVPSEPLTPGDSFTVTVDNGFQAMDGSRLGRPYRFSFRVPGPRLLARSFHGEYSSAPDRLPLDGKIQLVYSAPVELEMLRRGARLELSRCKAGQRTIALLPTRQRPIGDDDPPQVKAAGGWGRDTIADRFRRVVELRPADSLPEGCAGKLVLPNTAYDAVHGSEESYAVSTAPKFALSQFSCVLVDRCLSSGLSVLFTAEVDVDSLRRHVHLEPALPVAADVWRQQSSVWTFTGVLRPRTNYVLTVDSSLRDVDGREITGALRAEVTTGNFEPAIGYGGGAVIVPRHGRRSLPLRHVNVRSVTVTSYLVPDSLRVRVLGLTPDRLEAELPKLGEPAHADTVELPGRFDTDTTTDIPLPASARDARGGLVALRVDILEALQSPDRAREDTARVPGRLAKVWTTGASSTRWQPRYALVEVTDLAVHAKVGAEASTVLVTGMTDGEPRVGALVRQLDPEGRVKAEARTDGSGVARLVLKGGAADARDATPLPVADSGPPRPGAIEAVLGDDRVITPLSSAYLGFRRSNPLDPSWLGANVDWAPPAAATIFADRGIYRPGEMLYLKGVIRTGELGALATPPRQPVRVTLTYRPNGWSSEEDAVVHDTVLASSEFGTVVDSLRLRTGLTLGEYDAELYVGGERAWRRVANESFTVAEYRAPEFLVDARTDSAPKYGGDTLLVDAHARYLFGAPMANAAVRWSALLHELAPWEIEIPGAEGWTVGEWHWTSWDAASGSQFAELRGEDTLAADGHVALRVPIADLHASRPGEVKVEIAVTDVNRQAISTSVAVPVHPARLYVLARRKDRRWFWDAGKEATTEIRTVRPDGAVVSDVPVVVTVVRKEWRSRRNRYREWVDTTLVVDTIRTAADPVSFSYVPPTGGRYELRLSADDGVGGTARTTFGVWALAHGGGWWARTPYPLQLMIGNSDVAVGDTVPVAFDSPFDSAMAWVTVERERVIEQRRLLVRRGMNEIPIGIRYEHVPNVFVSVLLLARGAPARPDSAQRLIRVGYQELRVKTAPRRLTVSLVPEVAEYAPGDTAVVRVRVRGADGEGARSEVTLWAVDQGVLALTGYTTPDLLDRIYQPRGLGAGLWSTLPSILTAHPEMLVVMARGLSSVGSALSEVVVTETGTGVMPAVPSIRSDFRSTAFYLGSASTDADGDVVLRAKLPDNLTTYGVMAVAVGADDRFGSGDTTLLVTRPLVTRPALPRFVRATDSLFAGAVVNARDGRTRSAELTVESDGILTLGGTRRDITLAAGKGAEARFSFVMPSRDRAPDSVLFRFRASSGAIGDAVESRLAVKPDFHVRAHTVMGAVSDDADATVELPADIDPDRSWVALRVGISPLAPMLAAYEWLRVYPYYCTEQISSGGRALIAVWRATRERDPDALGGDPRPKLQQLADAIARRQRADGAIRYWDDHDWSSPWLSAYAGLFLLDARDEGIQVDEIVLRRLTGYLAASARSPIFMGGLNRYEKSGRRLALGDRVAALEYLRRAGSPDAQQEDLLLRLAPEMTWEDRLRLAEVLAPRGETHAAARALVDEAWKAVTPAGRMVDLPDSAYGVRQFPSRVAPAARLLTATLALHPDHPWLGALVERVLQQGRAERGWAWSTQDYASMVMALAGLGGGEAPSRKVRISVRGRTLLDQGVGVTDSTRAVPLTGLLERGREGAVRLRVHLGASRGDKPVYYALTVHEVPSKPPVTPDMQGIAVERWYERFDNGEPVTSVKEGELVRVRLRVTVPADREYLAVEDPLPAGLEVVDLSLATSGSLEPFVTAESREAEISGDRDRDGPTWQSWLYGSWDDGWWSPWEHWAVHDDKVVYFARKLWKGSYAASYVARATTAGTFVRPPAHAEEMYNPAVQGRSDGGRFGVEAGAQATP
jgi:uncharacterized protein YfaS (alpha-2-macroglobulin family)